MNRTVVVLEQDYRGPARAAPAAATGRRSDQRAIRSSGSPAASPVPTAGGPKVRRSGGIGFCRDWAAASG